MKKFLIIGLLFSVQNSLPVLVKMPNKKDLKEAMAAYNLADFDKETKMSGMLADKEIETAAVVVCIRYCMHCYFQALEEREVSLSMEDVVSNGLSIGMLKIYLFQNNPEASREDDIFWNWGE